MSNENNVVGNVLQFGPAGGAPGVDVSKNDVRFGVEATDGTGTFVSPPPDVVLAGVNYGANGNEFAGAMTKLPIGSMPIAIQSPVLPNGQLRPRLSIGGAYLVNSENQFRWHLKGSFPSQARFIGWECRCSDAAAWSIDATPQAAGNDTIYDFEMTSEMTKAFQPGEYDWSLVLIQVANLIEYAAGRTIWACSDLEAPKLV